MKNAVALVFLLATALSASAAEPVPPWAYPVNPPGIQPAPDDGVPRHVPDSPVTFSLTQIRNLFAAPDWHPADHPPMPDSVAFGRKPAVFACAYCHLPNGLGRPENASLAGLPLSYILQQVADFKSGARHSSEPANLPANLMVALAKQATEADVQAAAEYFSSLEPRPWIKVIETDTVPTTHVAGWMLVASEPAGTEPISERVIEMPVDLERTELRDARSPFIAYVPVGSIARGEALIAGGKTTACGVCHGADLKGLGPVPALAGRSPSYLVRQLYDMQHGARKGPWSELMKAVVAPLSEADMVAIAAYAASRAP
ncbi:MAG: cytochrome C-binding protein [Betaproteobacteria bacterium]